jgi:hypothetical protein
MFNFARPALAGLHGWANCALLVSAASLGAMLLVLAPGVNWKRQV